MRKHALCLAVILVGLAGCAKQDDEKRNEASPTPPAQAQSQAQSANSATPEQPAKQSATEPSPQVPATTTASTGKPPQISPDPKSDSAARGEAKPSSAAAQPSAASPQSATPIPAASSAPSAATPALETKPAQKTSAPPAKPIVLKDGALGAITFQHATHKLDCGTCHHPSREAKPLTAPQQACTSCHTKSAQAGMKTARQGAFHDPRAQSGTCIDCHKKSGGKAPVKCADCHKKA